MIEANLDITKTNILTKFEEDWLKNDLTLRGLLFLDIFPLKDAAPRACQIKSLILRFAGLNLRNYLDMSPLERCSSM